MIFDDISGNDLAYRGFVGFSECVCREEVLDLLRSMCVNFSMVSELLPECSCNMFSLRDGDALSISLVGGGGSHCVDLRGIDDVPIYLCCDLVNDLVVYTNGTYTIFLEDKWDSLGWPEGSRLCLGSGHEVVSDIQFMFYTFCLEVESWLGRDAVWSGVLAQRITNRMRRLHDFVLPYMGRDDIEGLVSVVSGELGGVYEHGVYLGYENWSLYVRFVLYYLWHEKLLTEWHEDLMGGVEKSSIVRKMHLIRPVFRNTLMFFGKDVFSCLCYFCGMPEGLREGVLKLSRRFCKEDYGKVV